MPGKWARLGNKAFRFVFHRESRLPPSSSCGSRQFDLSGKCLVCGVRSDPLKPGVCFCLK